MTTGADSSPEATGLKRAAAPAAKAREQRPAPPASSMRSLRTSAGTRPLLLWRRPISRCGPGSLPTLTRPGTLLAERQSLFDWPPAWRRAGTMSLMSSQRFTRVRRRSAALRRPISSRPGRSFEHEGCSWPSGRYQIPTTSRIRSPRRRRRMRPPLSAVARRPPAPRRRMPNRPATSRLDREAEPWQSPWKPFATVRSPESALLRRRALGSTR